MEFAVVQIFLAYRLILEGPSVCSCGSQSINTLNKIDTCGRYQDDSETTSSILLSLNVYFSEVVILLTEARRV